MCGRNCLFLDYLKSVVDMDLVFGRFRFGRHDVSDLVFVVAKVSKKGNFGFNNKVDFILLIGLHNVYHHIDLVQERNLQFLMAETFG
jgi:hypothetical protein